MADEIKNQQVVDVNANSEAVKRLAAPQPKQQKGAADWVRDLRMNADVNKTTVGVETDRVTPELMLATSSKLLGISRREVEPDPKDSLEFQRVYGPAEYFSEHILRDAGRLGRQLLWKATNRGNLDFMATGALDQHVSDVFNSSKLANMIDGSSPLETVDASFKVTRIGEGGVGDVSSAPDEMRLVQPSFLGYIDSVRSPECLTDRHEVLTINGWKPVAEVTTGDSVACLVNGKMEWHKPERTVVYPYDGMIHAYDDGNLAYELTPDHRAWCDTGHGYTFISAGELHGREAMFQTLGKDGAMDKPGSVQLLPLFYKTFFFQGSVYCLTVPGGIFYTRIRNHAAFWTGNSLKVGLDAYMTKHCMKGSDGKLYQEFINARTGKKELLDSVTAAKSVITTPDMMKAKTNHIYAVGGKTGVRIVKKSDVDYYLPNMDEAFSAAANLVTNMSGVKEMRLLMGCLHPLATLVTVGKKNDIDIIYAKDINTSRNAVPGITNEKTACSYTLRTTVAKFPRNRAWFRKIVLCSGRTLITSRDHRWPVLRDGKLALVDADRLKPDDKVLRSMFRNLPSRRTFVNDTQVTADVAELLGFISRSGRMVDDRLRVVYTKEHRATLETAVGRLKLEDAKFYTNGQDLCLGISDVWFTRWVADNMGFGDQSRIPSAILSARPNVAIHFLDAYTADQTLVAEDSLEYTWILDIPSVMQRDGLSLLWARMGTDTYYRDAYQGDGKTVMALKLTEYINVVGDCVVDIVKSNLPAPSAAIMVDLDIDDNLYATANGIVTHNSKYPLQAVSIEGREPPLVRNLDMRSGSDIHSKIGRYLGARYANKPGVVTAVRKDRIDVLYNDGTKGHVAMYDNFPMNAKGFLTNTPQVKAGDKFNKGDLLASSNYTDDKGTMATGTNLRVGWLSWHGGTYEDAVVLSESAAKKLTSTTMYSTDLDLDKTVALGKKNYQAWKPDEYTAEQLSILDDDGIVRPGTILQKGDPMVLAVRTTEPSPGTMGKRVLTDISETWEHDHPGKVTDIVRTRNGVRVLTTVTAPLEVGDKVSGLHGNKGVCSKILPDDQMPVDKDGKPLDMLLSPLGLISRCNPAQLNETLLGKIAHKTGKPEVFNPFYEGDIHKDIIDKLKQNGLQADDDFFDPETGRKIPGVVNGYSYIHKLKHLSESKESARGTDAYSTDETPGGSGYSGSKRFGTLEQSAMAGHAAFDNLLDNKLIRGQQNAEFWRSIRTGGIPTIPGEPLVQKKFFAHLQGAGVNVRKTPKGISVFALSNSDVNELAGPREVKTRDTYEARTFRPIDGGLFGQDIFGPNGDRWGYIKLDEPVPNPVMEEPLARLLRMTDKEFNQVVTGKSEVNGLRGTVQLRDALAKVDLKAEAAQAMKEFKDAPASKKDAALKRYVAVEEMRRAGLNPAEYMLDKIPVLPAQFRPVSSHNGLTMVADANYLYAQLLDARDDMRDAKDLPQEYQDKARENLYRTWQELVGLYDPEDIKLRNKNVSGLLKWALGTSPKFSAFQRKVLGGSVDTVGRGAIVPNAKLTVDQIGIPIGMAFGIMAPFVERGLVQRGYTPVDAMKMVKKQDKRAEDVLREVVKTHPVEMNRAPTLHKFNIMAFEPVLVQGHAIQVHPSVCPGFGADFDGNCVDFDTEIILNLSKSLDKTSLWNDIMSVAQEVPGNKGILTRGTDMRLSKESEIQAFMEGKHVSMRIGDFPRIGDPVKDRNGADVYSVPSGVYVLSCDPVTGKAEWQEVSAFTHESNCHTVKVTLGSRSVVVSDNESMAVFDSELGTLVKVKPSVTEKRMIPVLKQNPMEYGKLWDRETGWMIGAFLSDGWVTDRIVGYAKLEKSKRDEFVRIMRRLHDNFTVHEYSDTQGTHKLGNSVKLHLCSKSLADYMAGWKLVDEHAKNMEGGRTALYKRIPVEMLRSGSEDFLWGLLSGLLDGDGSIVKNMATGRPRYSCRISTSSPSLRDSIGDLLYFLGIRYSITVTPPRNHSNEAYTICPSSVDIKNNIDKIMCIGEREKSLLAEWAEAADKPDATDVVPLSVQEADILKTVSSVKGPTSDLYTITHRSGDGVLRGARYIFMRHIDLIRDIAPTLYDRVMNTNTLWLTIDSVEDAGSRDVFDFKVDGTKVYAANNGVIVWDTVNVHVPISDNARREAMAKMRPSRNLIAPSNRKIMYKPEKEYMQGLYIATRMGKSTGRPPIFRTYAEAKAAQESGAIDYDTPVYIMEKR